MSISSYLKLSSFEDFKRLPHFKGGALDLVVTSFMINIMSMAMPLTLMQVYDRILANKSYSTLLWLIIGCLTAMLFEAALTFIRSCVSSWLSIRFEHKLSCEAVEGIVNGRLEDFEKESIGTHLERFNSITTLRSFFGMQLFQVALDMPFALIFLAGVWLLGGSLVLYPIAIAAIYFVLFFYFQKKSKESNDYQNEVQEERSSFLMETLNRIHLIKSMSLEEQVLRRHEKIQGTNAAAREKVTFWTLMPGSLGTLFSQVLLFGIVIFGGLKAMDGELTVGSLTACIIMGGRFMSPIMSLANFMLQYSKAKVAQEELDALRNIQAEECIGRQPFPEEMDGSVELQNVKFKYSEELPDVLDGINLRVRSGDMISINGIGGAGTTTLLNVIMGTLTPQSGNVLLSNYELSQWDHSDFRGKVELLTQKPYMFKGSILDNIAMFDPAMRNTALESAGLLGLHDLVAQLPKGYETELDANSSHLYPGGLLQRVAIARSLVVRPRILLLDRVLVVMDNQSQERFLWILKRLKGACTVIMATDQQMAWNMSDAVYELKDGRLSKMPRIKRMSA